MKNESLLQNLNMLIQPIVESFGYELYYIEYIMEEGENYLRVYIDKEGGITLQDCEKVSRKVSDLLDVEDPIPESYYLEVSSPGMFRELFNDMHLEKHLGSNVKIKFVSIYEGMKSLLGILRDFDQNFIYINKDNNEIQVPRKKVKTINLEGSLKEGSENE